MSAFDFIICFVSCFCARPYTGCTLFNFTVSAFDVIICFVSCFCARHYTGCTLFLFYLVSAFDFIIWFVSCFCARRCTGCSPILCYMVSAFDFIFGRQMPFECTTHIRPPFSVCPLHSAFCTCPIILAVHYFYFTLCQPLIL